VAVCLNSYAVALAIELKHSRGTFQQLKKMRPTRDSPAANQSTDDITLSVSGNPRGLKRIGPLLKVEIMGPNSSRA
jgi:hypothetical protein